MTSEKNTFLIMGACCSAIAAIAHVGCIIYGAEWYRFFGAGEEMARMAEAGSSQPTIVTSVLVLILSSWALYGLSGAKVIGRLPLVRLALIAITSIYLLRGVSFVLLMPIFPENSLTFWLVSSSICLSIGILYAFGTYQSWEELNPRGAHTAS